MIRKGYQTIHKLVDKGVKRRKIPRFKSSIMMGQITSTLDYAGFQTMDLVIEAVPEKMDIKNLNAESIEVDSDDNNTDIYYKLNLKVKFHIYEKKITKTKKNFEKYNSNLLLLICPM